MSHKSDEEYGQRLKLDAYMIWGCNFICKMNHSLNLDSVNLLKSYSHMKCCFSYRGTSPSLFLVEFFWTKHSSVHQGPAKDTFKERSLHSWLPDPPPKLLWLYWPQLPLSYSLQRNCRKQTLLGFSKICVHGFCNLSFPPSKRPCSVAGKI